ncbi:MAG: NB-ARC domain-containing protein [Microcoleaceae cyanobacterium]
MKTEQLLELAESIVTRQTGKAQTELQRNIFHGALQNKSYEKIAEEFTCNLSYAKKVVKVWCKSLTCEFQEVVSKKNVVRVLEKKLLTQNSSIPPTNTPNQSNKNSSDRDLIKTKLGLNIPGSRCRQIWGRNTLINRVIACFKDPQQPPIISISGSAGYGKTEVASQIAQVALKQNLFTDVLWVTARQSEFTGDKIIQTRPNSLSWSDFLHQISHQLSCSTEKVHQYLRSEKLLVVLDNAETSEVEEILANLVKMLEPSRGLITSRLQSNTPYIGLIPITGLEAEWSEKLLLDEAEFNQIIPLKQASKKQLNKIHELSCGAPLALHFIVGRVWDDGSLEPVLSALEKASGEVEEFYRFSLETAWQRVNNISKDILRYMGRANAGVTLAELSGAWDVTELNWGIAHRELKRWYLIEETKDAEGNRRFDLHPWVRNSVRGGLVEQWQPSLQDLEKIAKWKFGIELD